MNGISNDVYIFSMWGRQKNNKHKRYDKIYHVGWMMIAE